MNTKIIATIGPKTESPENLLALLEAGVDVVRVNFSHATFEQFERIKKIVTNFNKKSERKIGLILDLQGPRIRVGKLPAEGLNLKDGEMASFSYGARKRDYDGKIIPIDSASLHADIKKGDPLFLCNGDIEVTVTEIKNKIIKGIIIRGGLLTSNKGINIPNTNLRAGGLTKKDIADVSFGLKVGVDYIALSFVQTPHDVERLRKIIVSSKTGKNIKIISKIERAIALKNIDAIISASDSIMVARGDLGIEIPIEDLPIVQKNLVRHSHWHDKPAIIATQVMTSMIKNPHPTRAEISDIANAVFDGADLIMLSDETAVGDNAVAAVTILKKVIERTEKYIYKGNVND
jgi:pyruvate kinase